MRKAQLLDTVEVKEDIPEYGVRQGEKGVVVDKPWLRRVFKHIPCRAFSVFGFFGCLNRERHLIYPL